MLAHVANENEQMYTEKYLSMRGVILSMCTRPAAAAAMVARAAVANWASVTTVGDGTCVTASLLSMSIDDEVRQYAAMASAVFCCKSIVEGPGVLLGDWVEVWSLQRQSVVSELSWRGCRMRS